ncbi:hypothetical protein SADUNF_Sadunf16G0253600 [Salix dunnii]|uniref:Malectin domain-containing protein n=1 Tax=Salix dunnii TaxID=1413687 RepID=A0A835J8P7_9ROSI|nr:hypothetical protein SADUNF_Sadunf16G0253600 [Salix dunnii]
MLKHRVLKNQNLQGSLPPDLSRFPYLQEIDLSRNYLNGSIPREWGATQMTTISIIGNRFTGPIPKEIGNISTLVYFTVEFNQFSGVLPPELGNLSRLEKLHLTSNNFTGQLPAAFEKLTALKDFRIGDNQFTGEIPNLIEKWTNLQKLSIIGNRFTGPIPKEIGNISTLVNFTVEFNQFSGVLPPELGNLSRLEKLHLTSNKFTGQLPAAFENLTTLKDFRIGDNQFTGDVPNLIEKWTNLQKLVIKGSGLSGLIPPGIAVLEKMTDLRISDLKGNGTGAPFPPLANMTELKTLDLSFNKLDGEIPESFNKLDEAKYMSESELMYWWRIMDISYHESFGVPSLVINKIKLLQEFYSFHINCGGKAATIEGNLYKDDTDPAGASRFYQISKWAVSTTGHFMDGKKNTDSYISINATKLSANTSLLYMDARLSPISLTYYGFCMESGNYRVYMAITTMRSAASNKEVPSGMRGENQPLIRTPPNKLTIIMSFSRLLFASLIAFGLATYAFGAAVLPADEVKALGDIAKTLGKTDWNFSADPCGGQWGWANANAEEGSENAVSCNCTFSNSTICHVTSM